MFRKPGLYLLLAVIGLVVFIIRMATPPAVVPASATDTTFSAERAYPHLLQICKAPHSVGTEAHAEVRQYIEAYCRQLGLPATVQQATALYSFRGRPTQFAARVHNIIVRLPGTRRNNRSKAVLVAAHYDSHPNTFGAGDDGAGVAAMLEVARLLKASAPLENDVIFLFSDAEEVGLCGAKAFVDESGLLNEIGVVLNFEARGSGGVSHMFETNNDNGWVMQHFVKAAAHPFANSLNFEVYKLLPNDTDFTLFKKAGLAGLNHAFINRLEDYHSMTDKPEKLDKRSLQHHGDNMLSLVKEFGRADLTQTKAADITYFNVLGSWIVYYPAWLNWVFVFGTAFLLGYLLYRTIRTKQAGGKSILAGAGLFLLSLLLLYGAVWLLQKGIHAAYPLNNRFYEHNAYNSPWFFFATAMLCVAVFSLLSLWLLSRFAFDTLYSGVLVVGVAFLVGLQLMLPTASYLLSFPLLSATGGALFLMQKKSWTIHSGTYAITGLAFLLPTLLFLPPVLYMMFVAFGLGATMPAIAVLIGLTLGLLLPVARTVSVTHRFLLPATALFAFLTGITGAHLHSRFTPAAPLQTNVWYRLNTDEGKAEWASSFTTTDPFNGQYLQGGRVVDAWPVQLARAAPVVDLAPPTVVLEKEEQRGNRRLLLLRCSSPRRAVSMSVQVKPAAPLSGFWVDGKQVTITGKGSTMQEVQYYGVPANGFMVQVEVEGTRPVTITVIDRTMGLPQTGGAVIYPDNIIPGEGRNSNTTQVLKTFTF